MSNREIACRLSAYANSCQAGEGPLHAVHGICLRALFGVLGAAIDLPFVQRGGKRSFATLRMAKHK